MEGHILALDSVAHLNTFHHNQRYTSYGDEEAVLLVHGHAVNDQRRLHRFRLLALFALLLSHSCSTRINEAKAMDILQTIAIFPVESREDVPLDLRVFLLRFLLNVRLVRMSG